MNKLNSVENILFLDIETVACYPFLGEMDPHWQFLWHKKCIQLRRFNHEFSQCSDAELYTGRAGIYAEFAKLVCITVGSISHTGRKAHRFSLRSFYSSDEAELLESFMTFMDELMSRKRFDCFCGHNIREFDVPFVSRRFLVNGVKLPTWMNFRNKRPWQIKNLVDTMDLWRFGDYKNYISLELMASVLGIATSKQTMAATDVHACYYGKEDGLDLIVAYCEGDVICTAQVYLRLMSIDHTELDYGFLLPAG